MKMLKVYRFIDDDVYNLVSIEDGEDLLGALTDAMGCDDWDEPPTDKEILEMWLYCGELYVKEAA